MKSIFYLLYIIVAMNYGILALDIDPDSLARYTLALFIGSVAVEKIKFITNEEDEEEDNE